MALEVNGERIADDLIRRETSIVRADSPELFADLDPVDAEIAARDLARDRLIARTLLAQQVRSESLAPEVVEAALTGFRPAAGCAWPSRQPAVAGEATVELKLDQLVGKIIGKVAKPKRSDVVEFYRARRAELTIPEMVRVSHIVKNVDETHSETAARHAIDDLARRLSEGEDVGKLADACSDCPGNGGNLGWIRRGEMVREFEEIVFGLEPGAISGVFRTIFGFHIARVQERSRERVPGLEEVYDRIADDLHRTRQRAALNEYVTGLRSRATISQIRGDGLRGNQGR